MTGSASSGDARKKRAPHHEGNIPAVVVSAVGRYFAGAVATTPPVGTIASAVLVDFFVCEFVSAATA
jgi:hypothetical protein